MRYEMKGTAMQQIKTKFEENRKVEIRVFPMGEDKVFMVTGGTAHVGAVSMAYAPDGGTERIDSLVLQGHREEPLAAELAELALKTLGRKAVVLAGIHLEKPTRDEIEAIVLEAKEEMTRLLQAMVRKSGDN
jgi:gallate decarboxylase subunit D